MARYSRRRGPPADFELTTAPQLIPGLTLTRFFDDGELLVSYGIQIRNASGGTRAIRPQLRLDGTNIYLGIIDEVVQSGTRIYITESIILPIVIGQHTIEVFCAGTDVVGDVASIDACHLTVIQLPHWDQSTDVL